MPRIYQDTLMDQQAYAAFSNAGTVNLGHGAQMGAMPDFRNFVSNTAYVRRNLYAFLIEAPRGFRDLQRPDLYVAALKNLVENWAITIDGLQSTLTVAVTETPAGGAGEQQQDPTNVTRARSEPQFVWKEKYGAPVRKFFESWIQDLIMDPNAKAPRIISAGVRPIDLLPDYYGMTVLFVEPDATGLKVLNAWLCTNMFPQNGIDVTGRRAITEDMQEQEYTVPFTALTQVGEGVENFAQIQLDRLMMQGLNSQTQQAFVQDIDPDVDASQVGWAAQMEDLANNRVTGPITGPGL